MSSNREVQERRREMIRTILMDEETPVGDQKELVELLKARGFAATQPSVSRDLRDLGAVRIQGRYQILDWLQPDEESPVQKAKGLVLRIMTVESNQILVVTERGAGSLTMRRRGRLTCTFRSSMPERSRAALSRAVPLELARSAAPVLGRDIGDGLGGGPTMNESSPSGKPAKLQRWRGSQAARGG